MVVTNSWDNREIVTFQRSPSSNAKKSAILLLQFARAANLVPLAAADSSSVATGVAPTNAMNNSREKIAEPFVAGLVRD